MSVPQPIRRQVIRRAENRCEYCGLSQAGQEAAFHIDHIVPMSSSGRTELTNLALACVSCSLRKGARRSGIDPETREAAALFNPRQMSWRLHFRWDGVRVVGLSPVGRATIDALQLNRLLAQAIRREEEIQNRHPAPSQL
jgi:hypothetical protein